MRTRRAPAVLLVSVLLFLPGAPVASQTVPAFPRLSQGQSWGGVLQGGMTRSSGEVDGRMMDGGGAVVFASGRFRGDLRGFMVFSEVSHGGSSTKIRTESYALEAGLQRDLTASLYGVANGDWERDPTHGVEHRAFGSLGLGATLVEEKKVRVAVEGGGGPVREELTVGSTEQYAGLTALVRGHWSATTTVDVDSELESIANLEDSGDRRFHGDVTVSARLWGPVRFSVTYLVSHDTDPPPVFDPFDASLPAAPAEGTVEVLTFQVGVSF